MDRLSPLFSRFTLTAQVFLAGHVCGTTSDHVTQTAGHLHVLRSGVLNILNKGEAATVLREPTVLLYPQPGAHTFQTDGADIGLIHPAKNGSDCTDGLEHENISR